LVAGKGAELEGRGKKVWGEGGVEKKGTADIFPTLVHNHFKKNPDP